MPRKPTPVEQAGLFDRFTKDLRAGRVHRAIILWSIKGTPIKLAAYLPSGKYRQLQLLVDRAGYLLEDYDPTCKELFDA